MPARSVSLKRVNGRTVSSKSKTGDPACSQAMSTWQRARHSGATVPAIVWAILGKCRSKARMLAGANRQAAAGQDLRAQVLRARAARGVTMKGRAQLASQLRAQRISGRIHASPKPAATHSAGVDASKGGWGLKRESAIGRKSFKPQNSGAGKTPYLLDMKKGDLPGQTSLLDRVASVRTRTGLATGRGTLERMHRAGLLRAERAARSNAAPGVTSARVINPHAHVQATYDRALDPGMSHAKIKARVKQLEGHSVSELKDVASKFGVVPNKATKAGLLTAIEDKIARRLSTHVRTTAGFGEQPRKEIISRQTSKQMPAPKKDTRHYWVRRRERELKPLKNQTVASAKNAPHGPLSHQFKRAPEAWNRRNWNSLDHPTAIGAKSPSGPANAIRSVDDRQRKAFGASLWSNRKGAPQASSAASGKPHDVVAHGRNLVDARARTAAKLEQLRKSQLEHKAPEEHGRAGQVYEMRAGQVHFDPERFQYKLETGGHHGVGETLKDVKKWDPELAGVVSVWKDPANGKTYVVNGHHRLDLANKLGVEKLHVKYLHAANATEARAKGAMVNIAEGRGSAIDAAKFFRDSGINREHAAAAGLSLREHTANQGLAMSNVAPPIFKRVVNGEITPNRAAIIGAAGLSHEQQHALVRVLDKPANRKLTDGTVKAMADSAKAAGSRTKTVKDLFGTSEEEEALFVHRAQVEDGMKRALMGDKRLFGLVSKSKAAQALAERGRSSIDTEETGHVSKEAASVLGLFDQLKHTNRGISKPLNDAAEAIARGEDPKKAQAHARQQVTEHIKGILDGSINPFG